MHNYAHRLKQRTNTPTDHECTKTTPIRCRCNPNVLQPTHPVSSSCQRLPKQWLALRRRQMCGSLAWAHKAPPDGQCTSVTLQNARAMEGGEDDVGRQRKIAAGTRGQGDKGRGNKGTNEHDQTNMHTHGRKQAIHAHTPNIQKSIHTHTPPPPSHPQHTHTYIHTHTYTHTHTHMEREKESEGKRERERERGRERKRERERKSARESSSNLQPSPLPTLTMRQCFRVETFWGRRRSRTTPS